MVADTSSRGRRLFPEIRIRTGHRQISLPPIVQIATVLVAVIVAMALCWLGITRSIGDRPIADEAAAAVRADIANLDLLDKLARLQDELTGAVCLREQAEIRSAAPAGKGNSPRALRAVTEVKLRSPDDQRSRASLQQSYDAAATAGLITQLTQALEESRSALHQVEAQRAAFAARLNEVDGRAEPRTRRNTYKARPEAAEKKLQQVSAERDKAVSERDRLRARNTELEQRHSERELLRPRSLIGGFQLAGLITTELIESGADASRPDVVLTDAPPQADHASQSVAEIGRRAVSELRRMLASTGLNVERLFPQFAPDRAEGGPFVPPPKSDQTGSISQDKLEAMRSLIKSLPLAMPLDHYQFESRFGPRHDPFNHRWSFHTGLDLSAPYMSPVYATAPGVVTYAGYRSDYGKVVEIDHGNGISTVYGHLHRYIVAAGQRVTEHTQIGLLGSTGRSTGPHVHYEILVNDEPQDPEKFIGLARVIPARAEQ